MVCLNGFRTAFDVDDNYDSQRCTQAFCKIFDYVEDKCKSCWVKNDYEGSAHDAWGGNKFIGRGATPMLNATMPFKMNYGDSKFLI